MHKIKKIAEHEPHRMTGVPRMMPLHAARRKKGGFTILETVVAVSLMTLLFIGTMELFTATSLTTAKVRSASSASSSAANAMQLISDQMKEAYEFVLPDDSDWPTTFAGDKSSYKYQWGSGTYQYSGIYVIFPPNASPLPKVVANNPGSAIEVPAFAKDVPPSGALTGILYFRGDKNHNPKSSGTDATYLWAKYPDGTFRKIVTNLASVDNSVNFGSNGANSAQFKIVCGEYSRQIGEQTSDRTDGNRSVNPNGVTTYTGVWDKTGSRGVQMRNAPPANLQPGKKKTPYVDLPFPNGSPTPGVTPTPTTPPSISPSPTPTPTPVPTPTPTPPPATPTPTKTPTPVPTPTPTKTPTPVPTPTPKPTPTPVIIG